MTSLMVERMEMRKRRGALRSAHGKCLSIHWEAENEMYERKLDVDNEQAEQVDEKRKHLSLRTTVNIYILTIYYIIY